MIQSFGVICLWLLFLLAFWGMVSDKWQDNMLQRVGLGLLSIVLFLSWALDSTDIKDLSLYVCLLIYGLGTIRKIAHHRKFAPPPPPRGRRSFASEMLSRGFRGGHR